MLEYQIQQLSNSTIMTFLMNLNINSMMCTSVVAILHNSCYGKIASPNILVSPWTLIPHRSMSLALPFQLLRSLDKRSAGKNESRIVWSSPMSFVRWDR